MDASSFIFKTISELSLRGFIFTFIAINVSVIQIRFIPYFVRYVLVEVFRIKLSEVYEMIQNRLQLLDKRLLAVLCG